MISFLYSAEKTLTDHVSALLTRNVQGNIKIFGPEAKLKYELSLCQLPWSIHFNKKWYEKLYMIYSKNKYVYIMRIFKSRSPDCYQPTAERATLPKKDFLT